MVTESRSDALSLLWRKRWGEARPIRHLLREDLPDRWVRFHSLPQSKQYAETGTEWRELIGRHHTLISALHASGSGSLLVIVEDYDRRDLSHGWTERLFADSWLWKTCAGEEGAPPSFLRISQPFSTVEELDRLLRDVADDEGLAGSAIITDESLLWLYAPYPGGSDVIVTSTTQRELLRRTYWEWLPA